MAITRAQQVRQMLKAGGGMLVSPSEDGKRPGYRFGDERDTRGFREKVNKQVKDEQAAADREDRIVNKPKKSTFKSEIEDEIVTRGDTEDRDYVRDQIMQRGGDDKPIVKDEKDISAVEKFRRNQIKKSLDRNKVLALRKLGLMKKPSFSPFGGLFQAFQKVPEQFEDLSEEDLLGIATSGPYLSQQKTKADVSRFSSGKDLLGRVFEGEDLLNKGDITQTKFEELFPGPTSLPDNRDDRPMELDPCKGPNPPAYCFVNQDPTTPEDPVDPRSNFYGLTPRIAGSMFDFSQFAADGGRIGAMDGGIMNVEDLDREAFLLGGIAKGLKKAVRGVKKIAKSPIGKAALIASGGYLLGGGIIPGVSGKLIPFAKYGSSAGSGFGFGNILPNILNIAKMPGLAEKAFSMGTTGKALTGILGASLLSGLMTPKQDDGFNIDQYYADNKLDPNAPLNPRIAGSQFDFYGGQTAADGGRIGYEEAGAVMSKEDMEKLSNDPLYKGFKKMYGVSPDMAKDNKAYKDKFEQFEQLFKKGYQEGGDVEPVAKKTLPLLDMGGKEKDYRETGGFVDMGRMERADDVPARLSKNEFVFTADAVRNAGEGDIDKGAEVMYNMMKNLEAGGEVSEESQGLEGARRMFQTSQRLGEVI